MDHPSPTRRSVAIGAAWTAPVLFTAAAAPAVAASGCATTVDGSAAVLSRQPWTHTQSEWVQPFSIVAGGTDLAGFNSDSALTAPAVSVASTSVSGTMFQILGKPADSFTRHLVVHVWGRSGVATNSDGVPDDSGNGTFKQPSLSPNDTANPSRLAMSLNGTPLLRFTTRPGSDLRYGSAFAAYTGESQFVGMYNDVQWNNYFIKAVAPTEVLNFDLTLTAVGQRGPGGGTRQNDDIYVGFWFDCDPPGRQAANSATPELLYPGAYYAGA